MFYRWSEGTLFHLLSYQRSSCPCTNCFNCPFNLEDLFYSWSVRTLFQLLSYQRSSMPMHKLFRLLSNQRSFVAILFSQSKTLIAMSFCWQYQLSNNALISRISNIRIHHIYTACISPLSSHHRTSIPDLKEMRFMKRTVGSCIK